MYVCMYVCKYDYDYYYYYYYYYFKFQFSKSIMSLIFHIFLNLTYSLRKNIPLPQCPKITQKFTQNRWLWE